MRDESSLHGGRLRAVHFVTGVSRDPSPGPVLTNTQLSRRREARNLPEQSWGHWSLLPFQLRLRPTSLRLTAEWLIAASRCKHKTYACKIRIIALIGGTLGDSRRFFSDQFPRCPSTVHNAVCVDGCWLKTPPLRFSAPLRWKFTPHFIPGPSHWKQAQPVRFFTGCLAPPR